MNKNDSLGVTKPITVMESNEKIAAETKKKQLFEVYDALKEKGYDPTKQLVGYILTGDPTYITTYNRARDIMRSFDRFELIELILNSFYSNR